jgi:hypothetical protein
MGLVQRISEFSFISSRSERRWEAIGLPYALWKQLAAEQMTIAHLLE